MLSLEVCVRLRFEPASNLVNIAEKTHLWFKNSLFVSQRSLIARSEIDIGRLSPAFPVTPPYMRVRIRRFRDLSQKKPEVRSTFVQ